MAAIRLDEKPDKIEPLLFSSLMDGTVAVSSSRDSSIGASADPLASSTWEEVEFCWQWRLFLYLFLIKFVINHGTCARFLQKIC